MRVLLSRGISDSGTSRREFGRKNVDVVGQAWCSEFQDLISTTGSTNGVEGGVGKPA